MIKICCITYKELDTLVRAAIANINTTELQITFVEGLREEIIPNVQREINNGAEVLLAGGANAKIAERVFSVPVLKYKISDFDYLTAIYRGLEIGTSVAIVNYRRGSFSDKVMKYVKEQQLSVHLITYEDTQELEAELLRSTANVVIGNAHAVEVAKRVEKEAILLYPGEQSILETLYGAQFMVEEIRKAKQRDEFANTVMRYTTNGLILIDDQETIIDYNLVAAELLAIHPFSMKNQSIDKVITAWDRDNYKHSRRKEYTYITTYNGQEILQKNIKLGTEPLLFSGAVIILIQLNDLVRAQIENDRRKHEERSRRGFTAKKYLADIIGTSYPIQCCIEDAKMYAKSYECILIYGETGVGKEVFAQGIHNESSRAEHPFVAINCGALSETLLEAELFGYDEGAFTGSKKGGKKGLFELAKGGTVFLDEIGEISPFMQTKLLRVLQEREIMKVGGECIIPVDVRIIAATNKDLEHCRHEEFRRDLLYRLNVLELHIPPLRQRKSDVAMLFEHFYMQRISILHAGLRIPKEVRALISLYSWTGNIRELQNVCARYCLYVERYMNPTSEELKRCIIKALGEEKILQSIMKKHNAEGQEITRELIYEIKDVLSYKRDKIAEVLGTSRTTIWRILKTEV
ncbi:sigma 54-interacting transcriptional regulator [Paenibacillus sp. FSL R10-2734]|uniref:sigma 54-interacting transcriptional regulator n=1 Tax=Paenibacillus sp. FSL R10-2734 TaxID=2954691 RepID=UPI0030DA01A2